MDDDPVAEDDALADSHARMQQTCGADPRLCAHGNVRHDPAAGTDFGPSADMDEGAERNIFAQHGAVLDHGGRMYPGGGVDRPREGSEEHTSELPSLMRISYAVFCLKK